MKYVTHRFPLEVDLRTVVSLDADDGNFTEGYRAG